MDSQNPETLMQKDELLKAVEAAKALPEGDPRRTVVEQHAGHLVSPEAYREYYRTMRGAPCPEVDIFRRHEQVKRFSVIRRLILERGHKTVLDLGCLDGWQLLNLAASGVSGVGVDLCQEALAIAQERATKWGFRLLFMESAIEDFAMLVSEDQSPIEHPGQMRCVVKNQQFDAVILSEVLEHVLDPVACFKTAAKHLKFGGIVYVSVPATPVPHHGKLEDAREHLRVYVEADLITAAKAAGLAVVVDHETIPEQDAETGEAFANRTISFRRATISVFCNHVTGGWDPAATDELGASEEMVVKVAEAWVRQGHEVVVHQNGPNKALTNGVVYRERSITPDSGRDLLVLFKTTDHSDVPAGLTVFWTTDLPAPGMAAAFLPPRVVDGLDAVVCISEYHRQELLKACPWLDPGKVKQHWLGVDWEELSASVRDRIGTRAIYASSYDRGLGFLLEQWPKVRTAIPDAELCVTYGWDFWKRSEAVVAEPIAQSMRQERTRLEGLLKQPGVTHLGRLPRKDFLKEMNEASVWAYPCTGGELCCKTALEAQFLGLYPVVVPTMALAETVQEGVKVSREQFTDALILAMKGERAMLLPDHKTLTPSWNDLADCLWSLAKPMLPTSVQPKEVPAIQPAEPVQPERFAIPTCSTAPPSYGGLSILMAVKGMPFDGGTDKERSLGGSETAALQLSRELVKRGHSVTVFSNLPGAPGKFDGVTYLPVQDFPRYACATPHDVSIVQREPQGFNMMLQSKLNILWCHDLALRRYHLPFRASLWNVDYVVPVSHWHGQQLCQVYDLPPGVIAPMRNGIDLEAIQRSTDRKGTRDPNAVVFASRPERGLDLLLSTVFPRLLERNPKLVLYIAGYDNTTESMQGFYAHCQQLVANLGKRAKWMGHLKKAELYGLYSRARAYLYPSRSFKEVSPLRGDALIDMPGGHVSIEELWREKRKNFLVYAYDHDKGSMVLAPALWVKRTRRNTEMVTVRYKWGLGCTAKREATLTLTPDHEVMLRDGTYRRADLLKPGDRIMPFNRTLGGGRYLGADGQTRAYAVISLNDGQSVAEHRFVAEYKVGRPLREGEVVDHLDGNPENNDPVNLLVHANHSSHRKEHWNRLSPTERERQLEKHVEVFRRYHASLSPEEMHAVKQRAALVGWENRRAVENHVILSVEQTARADAYCMEVPGPHNFVANGIVVHNCISVMEAAACGLPFIATDLGALPETTALLPGASELVPHPGRDATEDFIARYVDAAWKVLSDDLLHKRMSDAGRAGAGIYSWIDIAKEWEDFLLGAIDLRSRDTLRLARHWWRLGDIPGVEQTVSEMTPEQAQAFPQRLQLAEMGQDIPPQPGQLLINAVCQAAAEVKPKTVRGLGPHGSPVAQAVATALGATAVDAGLADFVFGIETLDCAPDPTAYLQEAEAQVADNGHLCFVTTCPGVQQDRLHRGQVRGRRWVFDGHDIKELLGARQDLLAAVIGGGAASAYDGVPLAWSLYRFRAGGQPGMINPVRRRWLQSPRLSLSGCMIVKDGEGLLGRCLKSIAPYCDELVVDDNGSTDTTPDILRRFGVTAATGPSPLTAGFDAARNQNVSRATGDFILWIDADEELLDAHQLPKYLRGSIYDGFGISQHHFSAVPPNAFKPDLPVRVYRRLRLDGTATGIRFFGIVHEHPEIAINSSVGQSIVLSDVHIAHDGYLTETGRRKRFERNITLMFRDRIAYPDRLLGKFLMIRDWVHLARYQLERNGRSLTPEAVQYLESALEAYRKDFLGHAHMMAVDGLAYYNEALQHLGRGFEVQVVLKVGGLDGQPHELNYAGRVASPEDLAAMLSGGARDLTSVWQGEYL